MICHLNDLGLIVKRSVALLEVILGAGRKVLVDVERRDLGGEESFK